MLLGNVGCLGKVLARRQQELIFGSRAAILAVGPVLFAFKECHRALLRRPFEDHQNLRSLALAFHPLNDGRASQVPAPAPLHHLSHILDVVRDPALVRYFDFSDDVILHAGPHPSLVWPVFRPVFFSPACVLCARCGLSVPFRRLSSFPRRPFQTFAIPPLPSAQSTGISPAVFPPPSAAPARC